MKISFTPDTRKHSTDVLARQSVRDVIDESLDAPFYHQKRVHGGESTNPGQIKPLSQ